MDQALTPRDVLRQVAQAIPEDVRSDIIVVGSLAAAYDLPGTVHTREDRLAVVRLHPPATSEWFFELLGAPADVTPAPNTSGRTSRRLQTSGGHFALPSLAYLGLTQFQPTMSEFGIRIALPEMMALANLLHHPAIRDTLMSQFFGDRQIKRSNKDLGRVVALAYLANQQDEEALNRWPSRWRDALNEMAPGQAQGLAAAAPVGLYALLASPPDIEQALHTVNFGLLSATPLSASQFVIGLRRLLQELE